jgi:hypothetical protein
MDFLKVMTGLKKKSLNKMSDFEHYKLMEIFAFIGNQKPYHKFIIRNPSISHYPVLYAPSPMLKGVTFGQFIFADTYFANYQQSGDETDLNKFIASLYLGKNEKFDERLIQERLIRSFFRNKNYRWMTKPEARNPCPTGRRAYPGTLPPGLKSFKTLWVMISFTMKFGQQSQSTPYFPI